MGHNQALRVGQFSMQILGQFWMQINKRGVLMTLMCSHTVVDRWGTALVESPHTTQLRSFQDYLKQQITCVTGRVNSLNW